MSLQLLLQFAPQPLVVDYEPEPYESQVCGSCYCYRAGALCGATSGRIVEPDEYACPSWEQTPVWMSTGVGARCSLCRHWDPSGACGRNGHRVSADGYVCGWFAWPVSRDACELEP